MPIPSSKAQQVLLLFFIDGLSFDLASDVSLLADELRTSEPVRTVLGYSVAAQPTVLTGKSPQEHGGLCMYYRSGDSSIFWWLPWIWRLERLSGLQVLTRRRIEEWTRRLYGITGYFSTYELPLELLPELQLFERQSFYLPGAIPGCTTLIDWLHASGTPYEVYYWTTSEESTFPLVCGSLTEKRTTCYLVYLSGLDHILHMHGTRSEQAYGKLRWYEEQIRRVLVTARDNYDQVGLAVFSDHGMLDVQGYWDLASDVRQLEHGANPNYRAMYDATMARFWFGGDAELRAQIMDRLGDSQRGRWLSVDELRELGCLFPDTRYGEDIFLMSPGEVILPSHLGNYPVKGMHGYHPSDSGYLAFWGSNRSDLPIPDSIADFFAIMRRLAIDSDTRT
jgi:hypothetical protein